MDSKKNNSTKMVMFSGNVNIDNCNIKKCMQISMYIGNKDESNNNKLIIDGNDSKYVSIDENNNRTITSPFVNSSNDKSDNNNENPKLITINSNKICSGDNFIKTNIYNEHDEKNKNKNSPIFIQSNVYNEGESDISNDISLNKCDSYFYEEGDLKFRTPEEYYDFYENPENQDVVSKIIRKREIEKRNKKLLKQKKEKEKEEYEKKKEEMSLKIEEIKKKRRQEELELEMKMKQQERQKYSGIKIMGMNMHDYMKQQESERKSGKEVIRTKSTGFTNDGKGNTIKNKLETYYNDGSVLITWETLDGEKMSKTIG